MKYCTVDECQKLASAQKRGGLCEMHQQRFRRTGMLEDRRGNTTINRGGWREESLPDAKQCAKCKVTKLLTLFWKNRNGIYGRDNLCSDCRNAKLDHKDRNLRKFFKITRVQFEAIANNQNNQCAICNTVKELVVDHDHKCCPTKGKSCGNCIRALLCSSCNIALGCFKDDAGTLIKAINYLDSWNPSTDYYQQTLARTNRCMICSLSKQDNRKALAKDHAHLECCGPTKMCSECFRGILCNNCNFGLGNFKDNIKIMERAIIYLTYWSNHAKSSNH